jgi:hypothetical protein
MREHRHLWKIVEILAKVDKGGTLFCVLLGHASRCGMRVFLDIYASRVPVWRLATVKRRTASCTSYREHPRSLTSPQRIASRNGVGFLLFEKFDGGREGRTLNPIRVHGSARIINPGHYRSCYPAVEDWQGRGDLNPRASVGETVKGSPTLAASLTVRWFKPLTHAPAGAP